MSIFIDLEMNPTDARYRRCRSLPREIIEIGAVRLNSSLEIVDRFDCFIRPEYNGVVQKDIFRLTGITNGSTASAPALKQALSDLIEWAGEDSSVIYQWSPNDRAQLNTECRAKQIKCPLLDKTTVCWTDLQEEFCSRIGLKGVMSLTAALRWMKLPLEGEAHSAVWDAVNSARLLAAVRSEDFDRQLQKTQSCCLSEAPAAMGGLPPAVRAKLAALLREEAA